MAVNERCQSPGCAENLNPILRISMEGSVIYCNEAGLAILDSRVPRSRRPFSDASRQLAGETVRSQLPSSIEVETKGRTFLLTFTPVPGEQYVHVCGLDITTRKHIEKSLREALEESRRRKAETEALLKCANILMEDRQTKSEVEQLKSEFTMTVTHEMRTPLAVAKGVISNILSGACGSVKNSLRGPLVVADRNIDRFAKIITNFFEIAKIDAGKAKLEPSCFDLGLLVREVAAGLEREAASKKVTVNLVVPQQELLVDADREKIAKVLEILMANAVKFTFEGDFISITAGFTGDRIRVSVADSGPGIPPERIDSIFDRFVQARRLVGPGDNGTGLGLAIARGLVDLHSGHIWAENRLEGGAIFTFDIPVSRRAAAVEAEALLAC
jgi:signal transduction histidine kinase